MWRTGSQCMKVRKPVQGLLSENLQISCISPNLVQIAEQYCCCVPTWMQARIMCKAWNHRRGICSVESPIGPQISCKSPNLVQISSCARTVTYHTTTVGSRTVYHRSRI